MADENLYEFNLLPDKTYRAILRKSNFKPVLTVPKTYKGKKVTSINLASGNITTVGVSKLELHNDIKELNYYLNAGRRYFLDIEEMNVPSSLEILPEFLFTKPFRKLVRIIPNEDHPRYKLINNSLVDYKEKALLMLGVNEDIPNSPEVETICKRAFCRLPKGPSRIRISKYIKNIEIETFKRKSTLMKLEVDKENTNFKMIEGCLIDLKNEVLLRCFYPKEVIDLTKTKIKTIAPNAFYKREGIKEIKLPEGVVTIKEGAFDCCLDLEKVNLPSSLKIICADAFMRCTSLKEVIFPEDLVMLEDHELFTGDQKLEKLVYPKFIKNNKSFYLAKETEVPLINEFNEIVTLLNDDYEEIIIPKGIKGVSFRADDNVHVKRIIFEDNIFHLEFDRYIVVDEMIFKDKNSEFYFKEHNLYFKATNELHTVFVPKGVKEFEIYKEIETLGSLHICGGSDLEKLVINEKATGFSEGYPVSWPDVKHIDIKNKNFDFDTVNLNNSFTIINCNLEDNNKYFKIEGNIVNKKTHDVVGYYSPNVVRFVPSEYEEFEAFSKQGKFNPDGEYCYIGTKQQSREINYSFLELINANRAYVNIKGEIKKVDKSGIEIDTKGMDYIKLPAKITSKRKTELNVIGLGRENDDDYIELNIPKNVCDFSLSTLCDFYTLDNYNVTIDKDNPYYEIVDGVFIDKSKMEAQFIVPYCVKNNEIKIKEGVKELRFNINCLKEGYKIYIPSSVNKINFNHNYIVKGCEVFVDENNPYFYVKDNIIYDKKTEEPLAY